MHSSSLYSRLLVYTHAPASTAATTAVLRMSVGAVSHIGSSSPSFSLGVATRPRTSSSLVSPIQLAVQGISLE